MLLFQEVHEDEKDKIYVLVSNSDLRLRLCLTKEAWNLIKRIPEISTAWINNEKMREQNYKEAVKANDLEALVAIIKMIYQRKQKRLAQGKKCTATDARYFQIAENLLYMELGNNQGYRPGTGKNSSRCPCLAGRAGGIL